MHQMVKVNRDAEEGSEHLSYLSFGEQGSNSTLFEMQ